MFAFVKRRAFLLLLGFVLVAVFIWYAGPYFAFADYEPLESATARLIAIALVVAFWAASVLLKRLRAGRASDQLVAAVLRQPHAEPDRPSGEALKLRERFEEAVATLKQQRRGGHSLYDLPWYVIIGAPGSGKTTALLNSGLKFPLEQRVGKGALRGVGGTRNCDWWFTDEAVFLDTAGRYTTQDSDAASDSAAWGEFLALLRKYRKRRPVNGVILTISAQDLMVQGEGGREAHVEAARRRLNELNLELHIQLPVYLMVTKCDLVAGFTEYFDDLAQEGRAQVWGVTFSYQQTLGGESTEAFPAEFEALMARLNARVFARLEEDRDVRRRTRVFAFPQQMAGLRDFLATFVADVFVKTRLDQPILLRGVYFTSGTQDGTPIDRLLGAIGRGFGVASDMVAPTGRGKAYFVERLLKEVLIGESGLAGVNRRVEVRNAAVQLGAYAAMGLAALVGIIAMSVSYGRNRDYITQSAADVATLRQVPTPSAGASLEVLLPRLDAMRAVVDSTNRYRHDVPWAMRWGLYQGTSVGNSARDAYVRELDGILLPRFAALLKKRLVEYAPEPEKLYEYLKAYLMLGEPRHLDKKHLQSLADLEWHAAHGASSEVSAAKHFQSLLEYGDTLRPIALDPSLVAQARSTVRQASIPKIIYGRIKRAYADDTTHVVRLDETAGVGVEQVFRRKSGKRVSDPVPGLYGQVIFKEVTGSMSDLVKQFARDDWVWGEGGVSARSTAKLAAEVTDLYEQDYSAEWDGILDDFELVSFSTVEQTAEALKMLAGSTSPVRGLLRAVADNTSLVSPAAAQPSGTLESARKKITDGVDSVLKPVHDALGTSTLPPGTLITAHFEEFHRLLAGAPGMAPIDPILARIGEIQKQLQLLGPQVGGMSPLEALGSPVLRGLLQGLQDDAQALPPPVRAWVSQIGRKAEGSVVSGATSELESGYRREVQATCLAVVAGRYPFTPDSPREVPLSDFGRLFAYGGVYDAFFSDHLAPLVDSSQSPWTWRQGSGSPSHDMLAQFEGAKRVREAFFRPGSQTPQAPFTVTIGDLDAGARRFVLQIDGQVFDNFHGKQPGSWPGQGPGQSDATFEDLSGPWPPQRFEGQWAWFRLIEAAQPQREGDLRAVLAFQRGNHHARVTVEAGSVDNPFAKRDWQGFSCGS